MIADLLSKGELYAMNMDLSLYTGSKKWEYRYFSQVPLALFWSQNSCDICGGKVHLGLIMSHTSVPICFSFSTLKSKPLSFLARLLAS